MRGVAIHPGLFLAAALLLCALVLWLRPEPPVPPPSGTVVRADVDPRTFDRYVGRYRIDDATTVSIVRDGARLYAELDGGARLELIPVAERTFYVQAAEATVNFPSGDGRAEELRVDTRRGRLRARRID